MNIDRHRWRMGGKAVKSLLLIFVFVVAVSVWSSPAMIIKRYSLMERKGEVGEENTRKMVAELVQCGPKAVPVLIEEIKKGYWSRGRGGFPQALAGIGQPGKDALVVAIDAEKDPMTLIYLIVALKEGFSDYRYTDRFFEACRGIKEKQTMVSTAMRYMFVRIETEDSPEFTNENGLNEEFVRWWNANGAGAIEHSRKLFNEAKSAGEITVRAGI